MNIEDWKDKVKVKNQKDINTILTVKIFCIIYLMIFGYGIYYMLNKFLTGDENVAYILLVGVSIIFMVMWGLIFLHYHKHGKDVVSNYHKVSKLLWNLYKTLMIIKHKRPTWEFVLTIMSVFLLYNFYYYKDILAGILFFGVLIYVSLCWTVYINNIRKNQNKILFEAITKYNVTKRISQISEISEDWMTEDTNKNKYKLSKSLKKWYDEGCPDDVDYLDWLIFQMIKTRAMISLDNHGVKKYERKSDKHTKEGNNFSFK